MTLTDKLSDITQAKLGPVGYLLVLAIIVQGIFLVYGTKELFNLASRSIEVNAELNITIDEFQEEVAALSKSNDQIITLFLYERNKVKQNEEEQNYRGIDKNHDTIPRP